MSVEDSILASLPSHGLTPEQRQARGRVILWMRDPTVDVEAAMLRLSFSHETAYEQGRKDGRREMFERYCGPRPRPIAADRDSTLEQFLRRTA